LQALSTLLRRLYARVNGRSAKNTVSPRAGGITWRWWVFDRSGGAHLDTGVIIGGDRAAVERAATYAIELLKQQKREGSPELPAIIPGTAQL
jgi:hypothetical protein